MRFLRTQQRHAILAVTWALSLLFFPAAVVVQADRNDPVAAAIQTMNDDHDVAVAHDDELVHVEHPPNHHGPLRRRYLAKSKTSGRKKSKNNNNNDGSLGVVGIVLSVLAGIVLGLWIRCRIYKKGMEIVKELRQDYEEKADNVEREFQESTTSSPKRTSSLSSPPPVHGTYKGDYSGSFLAKNHPWKTKGVNMDYSAYSSGSATYHLCFLPDNKHGNDGWRIVGKGTDNDGTAFTIPKGYLKSNGHAYWQEEYQTADKLKATVQLCYNFYTHAWTGTWFCTTGIQGRFSNFRLSQACSAVDDINPFSEYAGIDCKSFVTATARKSSSDAKMGLVFAEQANGRIIIKTIHPGSAFEGTALQSGMEILTINNEASSLESCAQIATLLRTAPVGNITIVAKQNASELDRLYARHALRTIVVDKYSTEKTGVTFAQKQSGHIVVSKVAPNSLFARTMLKVGSKFVSLNDRKFSKLTDLTGHLSRIMGTLTLLVEDPLPPPPSTFKVADGPVPSSTSSVSSSSSSNPNERQEPATSDFTGCLQQIMSPLTLQNEQPSPPPPPKVSPAQVPSAASSVSSSSSSENEMQRQVQAPAPAPGSATAPVPATASNANTDTSDLITDLTNYLQSVVGPISLFAENPSPPPSPPRVPEVPSAASSVSSSKSSPSSTARLVAAPGPVTDRNPKMDTNEFVTATVWKPSSDFKMGVRLLPNKDGTGCMLNGLGPASPLRGTALSVGMELIAINNQPCISHSQAAAILRASPVGLVTILAKAGRSLTEVERVYASQCLRTVAARCDCPGPLGVRFEKDSRTHATKLVLTHISPNSKFGGQSLQVNDVLVSVNNRRVGTSPTALKQVVDTAQQYLTLLLEREAPADMEADIALREVSEFSADGWDC